MTTTRSNGDLLNLKNDMKINHMNLAVDNVRGAQEFMQEYFDLKLLTINKTIAVLSDEDDFILTLMNTSEDGVVAYPSHLGFFVDDRETVDDLHDRLEQDGFEVTSTDMRHGTYDFYVETPGGFSIEVGA